jgi:hypothetical protein
MKMAFKNKAQIYPSIAYLSIYWKSDQAADLPKPADASILQNLRVE